MTCGKSKIVAAALFATITGTTLTGAVLADEQTLKFRLVTQRLDVKVATVPYDENHVIGVGEYAGVAAFEDGRIASKDFVMHFEDNAGSLTYFGYSTYAFEDGSTISARFDGAGGKGKYSALIGTGIYDGVKGSGWFGPVKEPWDKANLFQGEFQITTP